MIAVEISLDDCIDLLDSKYCLALRKAHAEFERFEERIGIRHNQACLCVDNGGVFTTDSRDADHRERARIEHRRDRGCLEWLVQNLLD